MKKIYFSLVASLLVSIVNAQWMQKSSMYDYGRYTGICFTINGKAYVGLGKIFDETYVNDFWEFDPATNNWTRKADYPGNGYYAATGFSINGKGYVCLGADNSITCQSDLWEYLPDQNIWERKADFPGIPRYGASCFVIGDTAFVGTGSYGNSEDYLHDMWMYIPALDSWQSIPEFPGLDRSHATAFTVGNFGYLGTGLSNFVTATSDIWKYDKLNENWTQIPNLPGMPKTGTVSFVIDGEAYVGIGFDFINNYNDFYKYNPETNIWSDVIEVPGDVQKRRNAIGFTINNIGYLGTGYTDYGTLSDLWAYDPNLISGIPEVFEKNLIHLYPNPVSSTIYIEASKEVSMITINNIDGQELKKLQNVSGRSSFDLTNFASGIYIVKAFTNNAFQAQKIVKQ